jgi:hypothetical protein
MSSSQSRSPLREPERSLFREACRQRDEARTEADRLRTALTELVRLKDGPRDDAYRAAKDDAWQAAREALA